MNEAAMQYERAGRRRWTAAGGAGVGRRRTGISRHVGVRGARDGQALRFLGIPYAEAPVTVGRFGEPVPPGRWDGIRDALSYGATSPQPDRGVTLIPEPIIAGDNELNLNVFTPDLGAAR